MVLQGAVAVVLIGILIAGYMLIVNRRGGGASEPDAAAVHDESTAWPQGEEPPLVSAGQDTGHDYAIVPTMPNDGAQAAAPVVSGTQAGKSKIAGPQGTAASPESGAGIKPSGALDAPPLVEASPDDSKARAESGANTAEAEPVIGPSFVGSHGNHARDSDNATPGAGSQGMGATKGAEANAAEIPPLDRQVRAPLSRYPATDPATYQYPADYHEHLGAASRAAGAPDGASA